MRVYDVMERLARNRVALLIIFILTVSVSIVVMAIIMPQLNIISAGLPILDTRLTYTYNDVEVLLTTLGTEGRELYSILHIWDSIYPAAYGLLLAICVAALVTRSQNALARARWCELVPIAAAAADYVENIAIQTQITAYPVLSAPVIYCASISTTIKWILLGASLITLLVLLLALFIYRSKT